MRDRRHCTLVAIYTLSFIVVLVLTPLAFFSNPEGSQWLMELAGPGDKEVGVTGLLRMHEGPVHQASIDTFLAYSAVCSTIFSRVYRER